ncbi:hypothetical protein J5F27_06820 [Schleiferilactobacillus harbinensis]|jgi:hypothetical protein|uniref:Uncharacterized protein n=1 Tax=Schleiferilactobacillus harbinensis TaxID=304207 RepID=A0A5P8M679_9LACO|nr:hypothetical protein [Schleiferilactobacillus harbinensis]HAY53339.1 hypothetical protein [Lactobacillus sp.]MBO3091634.1 hypothetical protein [Schleiferilactobacillus harbinensis]MCI1688706.1 hypothetical protein [Schleiferilactobacillus harbinensis]MCI1782227.1 hypothetical protein [Schleiferilactobacillus harbinensis]MCI1850094.1 hypothetical protein [Schleiferilactobacillus harbinensis]
MYTVVLTTNKGEHKVQDVTQVVVTTTTVTEKKPVTEFQSVEHAKRFIFFDDTSLLYGIDASKVNEVKYFKQEAAEQ